VEAPRRSGSYWYRRQEVRPLHPHPRQGL